MSVIPMWLLGDIFVNVFEYKNDRHMSELHTFVNRVRNFFADSDNSLQILEEYFLKFLWSSL